MTRSRIRRWLSTFAAGDQGMSTAEYAIGTIAAAAFATALYAVVTSDFVTSAIRAIIERSLSVGF